MINVCNSMKRNHIILSIVLLVVLLTSCQQEKETTELYQLQSKGNVTVLTFKARGDQIISQTSKSKLMYTNLNTSTKKEAEQYFDRLNETYQGIPGLDATIEYFDTYFVQEITVHYEKTDLNKLKNLEGFTISSTNPKDFSLKDTTAAVKKKGFKLIISNDQEKLINKEFEQKTK